MRPVRLLLMYLSFVFLVAALAAPWVSLALQAVANFGSALKPLAEFPFHPTVNRCLLFLALAGLWPFVRSLGIQGWADLGFTPLKLHWKKIVGGFCIGFCSLATVALLAIWCGARSLDLRHSGAAIVGELLSATLSAMAVAILEESLFRGALFGALRKTNPWPLALVVSSAVYALLHFFAKPDSPASIQWHSGFSTLGSMLGGFVDLDEVVPQFLNLFIVGLILGFVFHRTGNLYFSIGLHAGWVFWLRSYGFLTNKVKGNSFTIWGSGKLIDGWVATAMLLSVFAFLVIRFQNQKRDLHVARISRSPEAIS